MKQMDISFDQLRNSTDNKISMNMKIMEQTNKDQLTNTENIQR